MLIYWSVIDNKAEQVTNQKRSHLAGFSYTRNGALDHAFIYVGF